MEDVELAKSGGEKTQPRHARRVQIGIVESALRQKTIKVRIDRLMQHAKYGKYQRRRGVLQVHDERNEAKQGDVVEIAECRPISTTKSWRLCRVVRRSVGR